MDNQIVDVESKQVEILEEEKNIFDNVFIDGEVFDNEDIIVEHSEKYEDGDFQLPENIDGVSDFNLYEFVEDMKKFEKKYDLLNQDFSIDVFESEDNSGQIWQVKSETGIHQFSKYQDLKECFENTPERFITKNRLNRLKYKSLKIKNIDGIIQNKSKKIQKNSEGFKKIN